MPISQREFYAVLTGILTIEIWHADASDPNRIIALVEREIDGEPFHVGEFDIDLASLQGSPIIERNTAEHPRRGRPLAVELRLEPWLDPVSEESRDGPTDHGRGMGFEQEVAVGPNPVDIELGVQALIPLLTSRGCPGERGLEPQTNQVGSVALGTPRRTGGRRTGRHRCGSGDRQGDPSSGVQSRTSPPASRR